MSDIQWDIKKVRIKDLKEYDKNPRFIKTSAYEKLVKSLKEDGYHSRIKVNTDLTIIGGHQRKRALLDAGFKQNDEIEVLVPSRPLTDEEFKRVLVRDNLKYGEFDYDILSSEFDEIELIDFGLDSLPHFDLKEMVEEQEEPEKPKKKSGKECPKCGHEF